MTWRNSCLSKSFSRLSQASPWWRSHSCFDGIDAARCCKITQRFGSAKEILSGAAPSSEQAIINVSLSRASRVLVRSLEEPKVPWGNWRSPAFKDSFQSTKLIYVHPEWRQLAVASRVSTPAIVHSQTQCTFKSYASAYWLQQLNQPSCIMFAFDKMCFGHLESDAVQWLG